MPIHPGDSDLRAHLVNALRRQVPRPPPGDGPPRRPRGLHVFGVGVDWVQLSWHALGPGPVTIRAGADATDLDGDGGPGAVTVSGLPAGRPIDIEVSGPGLGDRGPLVLRARTLPRPRGAQLYRIATVNDVHIGSHYTGYFHTMYEKPEPTVPHPMRCFRAAIGEATTWGADELLVKGDLVDASADEHWERARDVLDRAGLPVRFVPGNHEWSPRGDGDPAGGLARVGHRLVRGTDAHDVPGLRVILADTSVPGSDWGRLSKVTPEVAQLAAEADTPVLVGMHHQPMRFRVPTYLPPGVPGHDARRFLSTLGRANPRSLVTSGHTHRHRRRRHGPVTVTEVGSTKDYPGTWAGYEVYEHGIVQTVHRIEAPDCIRWTDHTRRAALGAWQYWSPGSIDDRCFTLHW